MSFKFSLATVLRFRESLERKEQGTLEQCYRQLYLLQKVLSEQDERIALIRQQYEERLIRGTKAVELHFLLEQRVQAEQQREIVLQQVAEAQTKLRQQIDTYRSARRQREIIDQVRTNKFQEYQKRESLSEQKARDDLFLLRRQRHN